MRYLLFVGFAYYPEGGWNDFKGIFPTREAAIEAAKPYAVGAHWWHVVDSVTAEIVDGRS